MINFSLQEFCDIDGIGAASGLLIEQGQLFLVSDHASYLYQYHLKQQQLERIALVAQAQDIIAKKDKFDIEALLKKDDTLWMFGSGSTRQRNQAFSYHLSTHQLSMIDLGDLYQQFKQVAGFGDDALNIEGVIYHAGQWLFFQRGNGASAINGVFTVVGEQLTGPQHVGFTAVPLPQIQQVTASFTDAILVNEQIYFLAAVENSASTYDDGEVLGCFIGCMDLMTKQVKFTQHISSHHKFEGLALYQQTGAEKTSHSLTFLLCEDNDTEQLTTTIYQLNLLFTSK
ncbi:DUF6929 family protein [Alkanindiges sp. WGS2144]|uniref:DUF6929 family protein n=1 Tax=Alkanindiges sp. WGS2144 TaxID=3366808 RepID=UPI003750847D